MNRILEALKQLGPFKKKEPTYQKNDTFNWRDLRIYIESEHNKKDKMPVCFIGFFNEEKNKFYDILSEQEFEAAEQRFIEINGKKYEDVIITDEDSFSNNVIIAKMCVNGSILDGTEFCKIIDLSKNKPVHEDCPGLMEYYYAGIANSPLKYKVIRQIESDIERLIKEQLKKQKNASAITLQ